MKPIGGSFLTVHYPLRYRGSKARRYPPDTIIILVLVYRWSLTANLSYPYLITSIDVLVADICMHCSGAA